MFVKATYPPRYLDCGLPASLQLLLQSVLECVQRSGSSSQWYSLTTQGLEYRAGEFMVPPMGCAGAFGGL